MSDKRISATKMSDIWIDDELLPQLGGLSESFDDGGDDGERAALRTIEYLFRRLTIKKGELEGGKSVWVVTKNGGEPI